MYFAWFAVTLLLSSLCQLLVATSDERGHVSTVWQARKSGASGGRLYAIKCYAPHRRKPKEGQPEDALDEDRGLEFLEGIKQLKKARSEGGRYLPPIHAFGIADTGAWYVTDFYPRNTLKAWIARRGGVDSAAAVRHVIYSIVTGCLALKRSRGYSHGNLKSGNVFLVGKPRPLRHTPLHLADPYPVAPLQLTRFECDDRHEPGELYDKVIEARDLRALGELILGLVEGRFIQSGNDYEYPIVPSLTWGRLGKHGTRWRLLCNRLLDPELSLDKVNLESIAKEFRPNPVVANLPMILTALGGICLLTIGGFYGTQLILKGSAERKTERERQFGVATNAVWAAYRAGNLTNAIAEADKALAIHEDDAGIRKLKSDALVQQTAAAQQSERERQFGAATNRAWAAYRAGNLTNAIAEAHKALAIHGDDAGIRKLKSDALAQQTTAAQQAERERQFGEATNVAWAAYQVGNLTIAIVEADEALAIHGDDAGMTGARLLLARGNEQQPGTPTPTNNVPSPKQPELAKLDTTLETYEVLFRLKPPAPNIVDKNGTELKPLPLTLIPLDQKDEIIKTLKGLESGYQAGGWLPEREQRLQNLRGKIRNW